MKEEDYIVEIENIKQVFKIPNKDAWRLVKVIVSITRKEINSVLKEFANKI